CQKVNEQKQRYKGGQHRKKHASPFHTCSQAVTNANMAPMVARPRRNKAGSQTTRFMKVSPCEMPLGIQSFQPFAKHMPPGNVCPKRFDFANLRDGGGSRSRRSTLHFARRKLQNARPRGGTQGAERPGS